VALQDIAIPVRHVVSVAVTIPSTIRVRIGAVAPQFGGRRKDSRLKRAGEGIAQRRRAFTAQAIPVSPVFARQKHRARRARLQAATAVTRSRPTQYP
jgi:hypothetical protein